MKKDYEKHLIDHENNRELSPDQEDHFIVKRILDGNTEEYRRLVEKYQGAVYNLMLRMMSNREEARELTQETFVNAWKGLSGFRFEFRFFSWLYRIAVNLALNSLKKRKRNPGIDHLENLPDDSENGEPLNQLLIKKAVSELKDKYKTPILLKYYEQLSYKEIASVVGIHEKRVRSRLYDARVLLKKKLEATGFF